MLNMQAVAVCTADIMTRLLKTMHAALPYNIRSTHKKIANMMTSHKHSVSSICKSTTAQQSETAAPLRVSWNITKSKKPFTDVELIKTYAIDIVGDVIL